MFGLTGVVKYLAIAFSIGVGFTLMIIAYFVIPIIIYLAILFNIMKLLWKKIKNL